ncbi:hypothetical protein BGX38DRAFT_10098 [Terfezia claveryi]|nr:hypothetical protein BGX38DRAFT_10098 [Terfezia claveryi]
MARIRAASMFVTYKLVLVAGRWQMVDSEDWVFSGVYQALTIPLSVVVYFFFYALHYLSLMLLFVKYLYLASGMSFQSPLTNLTSSAPILLRGSCEEKRPLLIRRVKYKLQTLSTSLLRTNKPAATLTGTELSQL